MQWALTALVIGSVSVLVVALSIEQGAQAFAHPGIATARARFLFVRRMLLAIGEAGVSTGHVLGHAGRTLSLRLRALMASTMDAARHHREQLAERRAERRSRADLPAFQECALSTAPEVTNPAGSADSTSWFVPAAARIGWGSRILAAVELAAVIAVTGSAVAIVLLAVGWKATHLH